MPKTFLDKNSGPSKAKQQRAASDQVRSGGMVPIPATIMDHYRKVVLHVDVMKVNKIPFLVTISRAIKFGTVEFLKNAKIETIMDNIKTEEYADEDDASDGDDDSDDDDSD